MKVVTFFGVVLLAFLVAIGGSPVRVDAALQSVGATDGLTGFPFSYTDFNQVTLKPCVDLTFGACVGAAGTPGVEGFEDFYWIADTSIPVPAGSADARLALEMATLGGVNEVFYRIRVRIDTSVPGTYTIEHPFGSMTCTGVGTGVRAINQQFDQPAAGANIFNAVLPVFGSSGAETCVAGPSGSAPGGQFLTWTAAPPAPPPGFIGNVALAHAITPGPFGNFFRVTGPANAFGTGINSVETQAWFLAGQIQGAAPPQITTPGADNAMLLNRLSPATTKTINYQDPNFGDTLTAITTGVPVFCSSDNSVANQVTVTCDPTLASAQGTTPVTVTVTDNGALSDNVTFNVIVANLAPTLTGAPAAENILSTTDNTFLHTITLTAADSDNNAVSFTATLTPGPKSWFSFDNTTRTVRIRGPIPQSDAGNYTITYNAVDDGTPPMSAPGSATTLTVSNPSIVVQSGGGGGGCAVAGTTGGGLSEAMGAFGVLAILAVALAPLRRKKHHRTGVR
jgi:hypothetical protein